MKQTNLNNNSNFEYSADLDFIFEATGVAVLIEDINRAIKLTNSLFCNLFHLNATPAKLVNTSSIVHINDISKNFIDPQKFANSFHQIPEAGNIITNQTWQLSNGKIIVQDYAPLYNKNVFKGHIWVYKEYQNVQVENLVQTNFQLENALNFLPNQIAIYNTDAQIIFANKAYINNNEKRIWAKGKTLQQYYSYQNLPLDTALLREEKMKGAIATKKAITWEEKNDTNELYFSRTCYPVLNAHKKVISVIEHTFEITAQKKLEQQLQQATQHFYNTINSVSNIVLQTNGKLQLQFVNNYWNTTTGQDNNALIGKSIFNMLEVTNYELYQKIFSILNGEAQNKTGIISLKDKDKTTKHYQYNLQTGFSVEEGKQGVLATLVDVTNQKMQETQLLELIKKEKELNELKTAFVNMVSHELRTPLTVISSSAEILELMLQAGKSHEDITVYTKQIINEVEKMTAFMQDLLMISKIESGKILPNLSNIDVVRFVEEIVNKNFTPWKDGRKAMLSVKRNQQTANIDTALLEHSLQNILQNAFKYSVGKLSPIVRVGFSTNYFTISVIDDGIGIPEQDAPKLFTSFFRASNTGNISGTGIGLMVAKYFAEQHKGCILYKSKANIGSIFTIKLPY
jgi:PAS domain S-box-containing protein